MGEISSESNSSLDENEVRVRMYGEAVVNTLSSVASVLEYPKCEYLNFQCRYNLLKLN